jgi:hypothetical protein
MFGHNQQALPARLFEDLKKEEDGWPEATDEFNSALIIAYEQALESGLTPSAALAVMVEWISLEFKRIELPAGILTA